MQNERPPLLTIWQNPAGVVILTLLAFFFFLGVGSLIGAAISNAMDFDMQTFLSSTTDIQLTQQERQAVRWSNMGAHLCSFTLSSILIAMLAKGSDSISGFLQLDKSVGWRVLGWSLLALLLGMPAIQLVNWFNLQIPLPEALAFLESQQGGQLQAIIQMDNIGEFLTTFLIAAVVPAIGEELLFRGILQPHFQSWLKSPQVGIWVTAILFSAIHMQFAGFFPRLLLGAFLGYLLYWSKSLWLPILVHLAFNGLQIIVTYLRPDLFDQAEDIQFGMQEWGIGLASIGLLFWLLPKIRTASEEPIV